MKQTPSQTFLVTIITGEESSGGREVGVLGGGLKAIIERTGSDVLYTFYTLLPIHREAKKHFILYVEKAQSQKYLQSSLMITTLY